MRIESRFRFIQGSGGGEMAQNITVYTNIG
jgi:hypothetical protein